MLSLSDEDEEEGMSAPHDRPAFGDPGGCECHVCGVIFIGAPWHDKCAVCFGLIGPERKPTQPATSRENISPENVPPDA
jgi:hypothetical protein